MPQSQSILGLFAIVLSILIMAPLFQNRWLLSIIAIMLVGLVVFWSKRKSKKFKAQDSDLCLSMADRLSTEAPFANKDVHAVFFAQGDTSVSVFWQGRFLNPKTVFQLSDETQLELRQLVDELQRYYVENGLGRWNVMRFSVVSASGRFNLKVQYDYDLAEGTMNFKDYMQRFM